jgi:hypothetical protein
MKRREFLASSLLCVTAITHGTFADEPANEPSAFYFDNPWNDGETSVLGEIGRLIVHDDHVYCQPGEFRELGAGLYRKPFTEAKKLVDAKKVLSVIGNNEVIATDEQGQLIVTAKLDDNAKWVMKRDHEIQDKVRKKFSKNDHDQFGAYQIEHAVGVQGKKYLAIDPKEQTLELEEGLGKKKKIVAHRLVLTDKIADRQFVWYNDYSGK